MSKKKTSKTANRFSREEKELESPTTTYTAAVEKGGNSKRGKGKRNSAGGDNATGLRYRGTNDVRWYASNDQLLRDVAQLSFARPSGVDLSYAIADGKMANTAQDFNERYPGIMTIECIPTVGISDGPSSALNQGSQLLYNLIRAENSGARNYDAPDLMHYILGVDSLFIYYATMLRAYGTINYFTFMNRYNPEALVWAMGFDYSSLAGNMAQFRAYINTFAKRLSTYIVPHNITLIERHFSMFGRVYKDSASPKSQYYMYVPTCVWQYSPVGSTTGAALKPMAMRPTGVLQTSAPGYTFDDIKRVGDQLLAAMNDEDTLTMAGDMLKAFGEANIWKQDYIDANFMLEPLFDFTWLTQVQNLNSLDLTFNKIHMGDEITSFAYQINQVIPTNSLSPYLEAKCTFTLDNPILYHAKLLVSPYDNPSPGDIMESTRLQLVVDARYNNTTSKWDHTVTSCGAEIVNKIQVYRFINQVSGLSLKRANVDLTNLVNNASGTVPRIRTYDSFASLDAFAMHPTLYTIDYTNNPSAPTTTQGYNMNIPIADVDNWTVCSDSTLTAMHDVALLSMLYVRNVGFVSKY